MSGREAIWSAVALAVALLLQAAPATNAEVAQRGAVRVTFDGKFSPKKLPRRELAPIAVSLSGEIKTTNNSNPPQLRRITLAINRNGRINARGLPTCRLDQIQPATTEEALANCRRSVIGSGRFRANVTLPDQSPFPSNGRLVAFNGRRKGRTIIFAHIYGTQPLPTSYVLPFVLRESSRGPYAAILTADLPRIAAEWGFVRGISMTLERRYRFRGQRRSFLSAGCPAPRGFPGAVFRFARASFGFEDGRTITSRLVRNCKVRR